MMPYLSPHKSLCFETYKTLLTDNPILQYADFPKSFVETINASNFRAGATFSQGIVPNRPSDLSMTYLSRIITYSGTN